MSKSIVIVIQEGETHTFYSDRCVLDDVEKAISFHEEIKSDVDDMLADFERDFAVGGSEPEPPKKRNGRRRAENVEIKMSDRERTCRVCSSQNL